MYFPICQNNGVMCEAGFKCKWLQLSCAQNSFSVYVMNLLCIKQKKNKEPPNMFIFHGSFVFKLQNHQRPNFQLCLYNQKIVLKLCRWVSWGLQGKRFGHHNCN